MEGKTDTQMLNGNDHSAPKKKQNPNKMKLVRITLLAILITKSAFSQTDIS